MAEYLLENAWHEQRQRLAGLEAWFDPGTIRHLEALGVGRGWRCLEVGGGGGSIAEWLCRNVGAEGHVVVIDLDTRFLDVLTEPNLTVVRGNILTDVVPGGPFDLVHARFVVEHLSERMAVLRRMAGMLRPGGWLLIEETDSASWLPAPTAAEEAAALFRAWTAAYVRLLAAAGADAFAGRRAYGEFGEIGLVEVDAEGRVFMVRGGTPTAEVWRLTAEQVRDRMVEAGLMSAHEMEQVIALLADPAFVWMEGMVIATWGRRPVTGAGA